MSLKSNFKVHFLIVAVSLEVVKDTLYASIFLPSQEHSTLLVRIPDLTYSSSSLFTKATRLGSSTNLTDRNKRYKRTIKEIKLMIFTFTDYFNSP